MKRNAPYLLLVLLLAACFSAATALQPRVAAWSADSDSDSVLKVLLGDGRRIFANQAFVQADVYFHSGYYPSVFDETQAPRDSRHMTAAEGSAEDEEHERKMNFLRPPRDWIERFGRHFLITEHAHLGNGTEREILPWLKLSAELDPHRIDTYTVAAYFLRKELNQPAEAEKFLRQGLRSNPNSFELLIALARLDDETLHDTRRAHNVWQLALRRWQEQEGPKKDPDLRSLEEISIRLARIEEAAGDFTNAIVHLELAIRGSPEPAALRQQMAELKQKAAAGPALIPAGNKK